MPDDGCKDRPKKESIPLRDSGEYYVPTDETLPEPTPDKKIHRRRRLPLVPIKKPPKKG